MMIHDDTMLRSNDVDEQDLGGLLGILFTVRAIIRIITMLVGQNRCARVV